MGKNYLLSLESVCKTILRVSQSVYRRMKPNLISLTTPKLHVRRCNMWENWWKPSTFMNINLNRVSPYSKRYNNYSIFYPKVDNNLRIFMKSFANISAKNNFAESKTTNCFPIFVLLILEISIIIKSLRLICEDRWCNITV